MKKLLSLLLALAMLLSVTAAFGEPAVDANWGKEEYAENADIRTKLADDYTGKTVILHSNDVHGQIKGYAVMAALRDIFKGKGAEVILADAGDFTQGSVYVSFSKGETAVGLMNEAGYTVVTLGNHEFDFGYAQLKKNLEEAKFAVVCCDVFLDETGEPIYPAAYTYTTESGMTISFVGVETPETATKVNPGLIKEISFASFDKLYSSVQTAIDGVRESSDLVIGLCHLGVDVESSLNEYRSTDLLKKVTGLDFVIDGHSHTVMTAGQDGEPIQSTGTAFANIGVIVIDNETKKIEENFVVPTTLNGLYNLASDPEVQTATDIISGLVDLAYNKVFATTEVELNGAKAPGNRTEETNLGDLVIDALVWSVVVDGGIDDADLKKVVGITNGGGIRATIPVGDVTKKDINTVLPFGNTVAVVYITGAELLEALEASTFCTPDPVGGFPQTNGIEWTLDTTKEFDKGDVYMLEGKDTSYFAPKTIQRVTITAINGEPFDPEATYAVVTNNFCAVGGDTYNVFANATKQFDTGITLDEAVMEFVEEELNGVISAERYGEPAGRMTIIKGE